MKPAPFLYYRPDSVEEALAALAQQGDDAKLLAGGQSLVPMMNFRLAQPAALVDLAGVGELVGIRRNGALEIGAMTRQSAVMDAAVVAETAPLLVEALTWVGHTANRNRGTFGGSVAHADPAAELPAALLALEAEMLVAGPAGARVVPADDFFLFYLTTALEPDELLRAVRVPAAPDPKRRVVAFTEVARRRGDFALAGVALVADLDAAGAVARAAIALLGVDGRPVRMADAEALLAGGSLADAALRGAVAARTRDALDPASDHHGSAEYRKDVAAALVERALRQAALRAGQAPAGEDGR